MDVLPNKNLRAQNYPCLSCPYCSEKTCAKCIFAKWNVEGILAGFHLKKSYRLQHRADLTQSPLILNVPKNPTTQVMRQVEEVLHPHLSRLVIPSYNRIHELLNVLEG